MAKSGYTAINPMQYKDAVVVGASVAETEIATFAIRGAFNEGFVVDIESSAVTVGAGITAKLQTRMSTAQAWQDSKTVSITATGTTTLRLLAQVAGDQIFLPLKPLARLVVATTAGSALTVSAVYVIEAAQ